MYTTQTGRIQIFDQLSAHFFKTASSSTAKLFVKYCLVYSLVYAIQCHGHFRGVEEGENAKCLITEHEHTQGNNKNNNNNN